MLDKDNGRGRFLLHIFNLIVVIGAMYGAYRLYVYFFPAVETVEFSDTTGRYNVTFELPRGWSYDNNVAYAEFDNNRSCAFSVLFGYTTDYLFMDEWENVFAFEETEEVLLSDYRWRKIEGSTELDGEYSRQIFITIDIAGVRYVGSFLATSTTAENVPDCESDFNRIKNTIRIHINHPDLDEDLES